MEAVDSRTSGALTWRSSPFESTHPERVRTSSCFRSPCFPTALLVLGPSAQPASEHASLRILPSFWPHVRHPLKMRDETHPWERITHRWQSNTPLEPKRSTNSPSTQILTLRRKTPQLQVTQESHVRIPFWQACTHQVLHVIHSVLVVPDPQAETCPNRRRLSRNTFVQVSAARNADQWTRPPPRHFCTFTQLFW